MNTAKIRLGLVSRILALGLLSAMPCAAQALPDPIAGVRLDALSIQRFELANGLEVVLLPDSSQDEVAVELWTHSGTRDEPAGRFGMAHFFEHVMPHGAAAYLPSIRALADSLRTDSNARTRRDYTRYFQQTRREGADLFLLLAAARLGSDPSVDLTPKRVESERARVEAEIERFTDTRWGEPIGVRLKRGTFGEAHPYGHDGYGNSDETTATTRDDLIRWQLAHVRPEYSTLFVAGGFDPAVVRPLVERLFGRIPGGVRPHRAMPRVPPATGGRDSAVVHADQSLLFLAWPTPEWDSDVAPLLELFGQALGVRLAASRPREVGDVSVEPIATELAGSFTIVVTHDPGADPGPLEAWVRETLVRTSDDLTPEEVTTARRAERERVAEDMASLGWIGSRIELVGESLMFSGDPEGYLTRLEQQATAVPSNLQAAARVWLVLRPAFVLIVRGTGGG